MGPQMIGSAVQASSANDWRSYAPPSHAAGADGPPGGSITEGGISTGGVLGALGGIIGGVGGKSGPGYSDSTGGQILAAQQGGGTLGNISRGVALAGLGYKGLNKVTGGATSNSTVGATLGTLGGGLQFIRGIQQGGVMGYGNAAVGGLRAAAGVESLVGNSAASTALGAAAGYVAAPLAVYSAIKNWQSGKTGQDTIQGAEAGATVGSAFFDGVGAVIGGVIGGVVGAVSSAFGGGATSTEAMAARNYDKVLAGANNNQRAGAISGLSAAQSFQMVNGYMNAHDSSPGHSEQIQQVFGKNGVGNMFGQMMPAINAAIAKNPKLGALSATQMYSQVVAPWLKSKGATISAATKDVKGNPEGQNLIDSITNVIGDWQKGAITSNSQLGVSGEKMNIPAYGPNG